MVKLNPAGRALIYATFLGGSGSDYGIDIALDQTGNAYVTGFAGSTNFPTTPGALDTSYNGRNDVFVAKLTPTGDALVYATFLGSSENDYGYDIAVDQTGNAYVTGYTESIHFPTTPGAFDTSHNGSNDAFMVKLNAVYIANVLAPIEQPSAGTFVSGTITLQGFAIDLTSSAGTGIDRVHIYLDGLYDAGGATYGLDRPDIAARYGPSGWELVWDASGLTSGVHSLYVYAHRTTDDAWTVLSPHLVVVRAEHGVWLPLGISS